MRVKVLLFDSSHLEDVFGFQRSYLSILHTAIENQIDINVIFIGDVNTNGDYGKFLKAAQVLHDMVKEKLDEVHCDVWITTSIRGGTMIFTTINTDSVITMINGRELYAPEIGSELRKLKEEQNKKETACNFYNQAQEEKDSYTSGTWNFDQSSVSDKDSQKKFPTRLPPEIIAMQNIREGKEYLNEEE